MPIKLQCPNCAKELNAPDTMLGRLAACPRCNTQFPVTADGAPAPSPPQNGTAPGNGPVAPPPARGVAGDRPPPAQPPAARPRARRPLRPPAERTVRRARFVSGEPSSSRLQLGQNGQLPELVVREGAKAEPAADQQQTSRPLLLAVALCVSAGLSILLLFVDIQPATSPSAAKDAARRQLERYYIGKEPPFLPYQQLLRQALWADNHGDRERARRLYRRVLDMIHAESNTGSIGLTGPKAAVSPPTDRDLEKQLSILLSDR